MKDRMAEPDIFGVQLEVTSRLLDAEKRRLQVLSKELRSKQPDVVQEYQDARKQRDFERRKAYLARLQLQHDVLEREFRDAALGMYKRYHRGAKSQRSLPHLGIKQTNKNRANLSRSWLISGAGPKTGGLAVIQATSNKDVSLVGDCSGVLVIFLGLPVDY
ncbi:uncharacterized protein LOC121432159 [Lytechinus variegatus]|uniref:uncharacterized protein LOC121432159 n=1 Tax=Lytechinus variegatus TaxID=7654 RepID=UPI001BB1931E|nr:uncharacterized protein LOC121432159 [Lytechinus variegatus]